MYEKAAKYWIDLDGTIHLVCILNEGPQLCHEEWAEAKGKSLEKLLDKGWVRVQYIIPHYVYIDYHKINDYQKEALKTLLEKPCEKVVVESKESNTFTDAEKAKNFIEAI
jgi:predicted transcriptional regulator